MWFPGNNPGMGHRPILFEEGALIWYDASNSTQIKKYVDNIDKFLDRKYFGLYLLLHNNFTQCIMFKNIKGLMLSTPSHL